MRAGFAGTRKSSFKNARCLLSVLAVQEMAEAGRRNALLGAPDTGRVNYFLNSGFEQVAMRTTRMSFDHIKQLRTISADVLRTASLTGETRAQVTKEMLARAAEIPGFKFTAANGVVWKDQAYFKMLARTELMNAGRTAYDDKCAAEGCDVVMLDYSGNCCEACGKWEGQLFSLTGATPGLPTKADLEADGVFHPNCTHSYSAVPDYVQKTEFNPDGKPKQATGPEPEVQQPEKQYATMQPNPNADKTLEVRAPLTDYERSDVRRYTGHEHEQLNAWMAGDTGKFTPEQIRDFETWRDSLNSAIGKSIVNRETEVLRGVGGDYAKNLIKQAKKIGVIEIDSFQSCSEDINKALDFASKYGTTKKDRVILKIVLPPGANALPIGQEQLSLFNEEKEILTKGQGSYIVTKKPYKSMLQDGRKFTPVTIIEVKYEQ